MKIIISPAKQMKEVDIQLDYTSPLFLKKTEELVKHIQSLDYPTLKKVLKCNDKLASQAYDYYQLFHRQCTYPALMCYSGIQYQYMHSQIFEDIEIDYLQDHLYILSGLYGLLKPKDGIHFYRLEMQAKLPFSLYEFWKDEIAKAIEEGPILNLASEEYAKVIRKYRQLTDVRFVQFENGKYIEKGVYAKMARGAMVRYCAQNQIENISEIINFDEFGYSYQKELSTDNCYVFLRD
ncbi:MAG: peroxide stress protein YaaA [Floccifex sp.]